MRSNFNSGLLLAIFLLCTLYVLYKRIYRIKKVLAVLCLFSIALISYFSYSRDFSFINIFYVPLFLFILIVFDLRSERLTFLSLTTSIFLSLSHNLLRDIGYTGILPAQDESHFIRGISRVLCLSLISLIVHYIYHTLGTYRAALDTLQIEADIQTLVDKPPAGNTELRTPITGPQALAQQSAAGSTVVPARAP